jgi:hypothetical protein
MKTPLTSIYGSAGAAVALIPSLLWHLSGGGLRMANSGEELLDLFEERYCAPQERVLQEKARCGFSAVLSDCRGWQ